MMDNMFDNRSNSDAIKRETAFLIRPRNFFSCIFEMRNGISRVVRCLRDEKWELFRRLDYQYNSWRAIFYKSSN